MFAIKRRRLMGVFTVAHILNLDPLTRKDIGELLGTLLLLVKTC